MQHGSTHLPGVLLVAVSLACFSAAPGAQETASLPYRVVYQQLQTLDRLDKLQHVVTVNSTSSDVAPTDIRITIDDSTKRFEFTPDASGSVDLPIRADWNDADLELKTNQPKGSLAIRFSVGARPLASTHLRYRDLMEIRRQFEQAFAMLARTVNEVPPRMAGIEIRFNPSAKAGVVILAAGGRQVHEADGEGIVRLPEEAALWAENPDTVLEAMPELVAPWLN
jgi:hypothetical protein